MRVVAARHRGSLVALAAEELVVAAPAETEPTG
jgi:hypothetical protein